MMLKSTINLITFSMIVFLHAVVADAQLNFADYAPGGLGSYWTYEAVGDPTDTYTESVFEYFTFAGNPAYKTGTDINNYNIGFNDGTSVTMYASVKGGVLNDFTDVTISNITDGMFFNAVGPSNFILIREWDNLDPSTKSVFGIDPTLNNLVLWAAYDSNYSSNSNNAIVESNLSISIPDYAVTHLRWYEKNVGYITDIDIAASNGAIGTPRYELTNYAIAPEPVSSTLFIIGGATLGFRRFRKRKL